MESMEARILEWVAVASSRGSSQPRDQTCISYVSCIIRQIFITSDIWEALSSWVGRPNLLNHTTSSYLDSSQSLSKFQCPFLLRGFYLQ